MKRSAGFAPVVQADACVLVLGSLPGQRSLADREYYAHPRNAFWPIMQDLFGISGSYAARCAGLMTNNIALWDVLQTSVRPGSLDADIRLETATANDFMAFLRKYSAIEKIVFNGNKAEQLFGHMVPSACHRHIHISALPSTSAAYAAMPFDAKLAAWRAGLESVLQ